MNVHTLFMRKKNCLNFIPLILCQLPSQREFEAGASNDVSICPLDALTKNLIVPFTISKITWSFLPWMANKIPDDDLGLMSIRISIFLPTVNLSSENKIFSIIYDALKRVTCKREEKKSNEPALNQLPPFPG